MHRGVDRAQAPAPKADAPSEAKSDGDKAEKPAHAKNDAAEDAKQP